MAHRKEKKIIPLSVAYIQEICALYGDHYDDRLEDSRPPVAGRKNGQPDKRLAGEDWESGIPAAHKSLSAFQRELMEEHSIRLSTSKIRKILVSGGMWTTERSREVQELYEELTRAESGISPERAVGLISKELGISKPTVVMNLPYINGVNCLEPKSPNATRCARYRAKKKERNQVTANHTADDNL